MRSLWKFAIGLHLSTVSGEESAVNCETSSPSTFVILEQFISSSLSRVPTDNWSARVRAKTWSHTTCARELPENRSLCQPEIPTIPRLIRSRLFLNNVLKGNLFARYEHYHYPRTCLSLFPPSGRSVYRGEYRSHLAGRARAFEFNEFAFGTRDSSLIRTQLVLINLNYRARIVTPLTESSSRQFPGKRQAMYSFLMHNRGRDFEKFSSNSTSLRERMLPSISLTRKLRETGFIVAVDGAGATSRVIRGTP